jgi:hypothetical protein
MTDINNNSKKLTPKERYEFLINARNFHYDNFNKWMTYFYVAIGALFVGYYTIASSENLYNEKIILIVLGYITSLFWYWSSKGYYFWNINFITLVNDCETNTLKLKKKKRVYSVFANKKTQNNYLNPISGANISTSKIAILFSFIISIIWGILLLEKLKEIEIHFICEFLVSLFITLLLSYIIPKYLLKSKIDHFPDLEIEQTE